MTSPSDRALHSRPAPRRASGRTALMLTGLVASTLAVGVFRPTAQATGQLTTLAPTTTAAGTTSTTAKPSTTSTTAATTAAVAPLGNAATVTKPAKRLRQMGTLLFPMEPAPRCAILDNFREARGSTRSHEGVDILATEGQDVYAVADGVLKRQYVVGGANSSLSGNAWQLNAADGTYYFFAHLSGFAEGLEVGDTVSQGDVIGYVGDTGNPGPGNYHLHFEVHPGGGTAVDPLSLLEIPAGCTIT